MQSLNECSLSDFGLVSIIMPNYNSERFVANSIKSVLAQTYVNWELLFVDDCSTDKSVEIAKSFNDDRIKFFSTERNSGAAVARNKAIEAANGRWLAFLDSDDLWLPEKLEKQLSFMVGNDIAFSFTSYFFKRDDSQQGQFLPKKTFYNYNMILKHCYVGCSTVIYDRGKLGRVFMNIQAVKREDFACWLAILRKGVNAYCFAEPLTLYTMHSNSVSSKKIKMVKYQWNVYRKIENLSFFKSVYYLMNWAIRGVLKYR